MSIDLGSIQFPAAASSQIAVYNNTVAWFIWNWGLQASITGRKAVALGDKVKLLAVFKTAETQATHLLSKWLHIHWAVYYVLFVSFPPNDMTGNPLYYSPGEETITQTRTIKWSVSSALSPLSYIKLGFTEKGFFSCACMYFEYRSLGIFLREVHKWWTDFGFPGFSKGTKPCALEHRLDFKMFKAKLSQTDRFGRWDQGWWERNNEHLQGITTATWLWVMQVSQQLPG